MMTMLFAATLAVSCPKPKIDNPTAEWTVKDALALSTATTGCKRFYSPQHCLTRFIKLEEGHYQAICRKL